MGCLSLAGFETAWLTIVGGFIEIVGLGIVAYEIGLIERRELGHLSVVRRVLDRLRALVGRPRIVPLSATMSSSATIRARGKVVVPPKVLLEDRLARVEQQFEILEAGRLRRIRGTGRTWSTALASVVSRK